ncbi:YcdB/YcdC domain-containing protein [Clostridium gasigenes]|uniref:YcdB/YcdC repeated domain-containing protein n=1 Tax=Clostridium gasigenes TaxID=94869 RepID=A0A1H0MNJ1_9CLOT|nr:YcdB/YcdC domain-containing protein [Clostridium gasigenes]SDO81947.1 hypothetical protein SAMN04488529_101518 [Clostridium gasigenes]
MKGKKKIIAFTLLIISLLIAIGFTIVSLLDNKAKEVKVAKRFVEKLQKMDIIDTKLNVEKIEFKSVDKVINKNSKTQYIVVGENLGINLDSKYVVTGFSEKVKEDISPDSIIDKDNAKILAEEYVSKITNEKFEFKEVREVKEEEKKSNTYTIAFYKYVKDYPCYDNEIVVNINRTSGKLQSYTNQSINKVKYNIKKNIDLEEAKNISIEYFSKLNIKLQIVKEPLLSVTLRVDGEFELSYVVDLNVITNDGKIDKYKLFINAESGEVVNRTSELIQDSTSN